MRVVSSAEMKNIEEIALKEFAFNDSLIIENVGLQGADFIESILQQELSKKAKTFAPNELVFLIGRGNNGADGLAMARQLANRGHVVRAFLLFPDEEASTQSQIQLKLAQAYGVKISPVKNTENILSYFTQAQDNYFVVDAIFGTGVRLPISNFLFEIITTVNDYSTLVISIDIASGVSGDNGSSSGTAILAHYTLAIGTPKLGHFMGDGARHTGELVVIDGGLPNALLEDGEIELLNPEKIAGFSIAKRSKFGHKNSFGHCLLIGGSQGMTGALIMAGAACLRSGVGLVSTATWEKNYLELASRVPAEIMSGVLPSREKDFDGHIKGLNRYSTIVCGPGLGRSEEARSIVLGLLQSYSGPLVLDADAINVLNYKKDQELFRDRQAPTILTPHVGEFCRFAEIESSDLLKRPIDYLKEMVDGLNCTIVLKDACSYIGLLTGKTLINYFPNDGMAKGGSGDVLAGLIGGLVAQLNRLSKEGLGRNDLLQIGQAVCLGVHLHSVAGKHLAQEIGTRPMSAMQLVEFLPNAFFDLENYT